MDRRGSAVGYLCAVYLGQLTTRSCNTSFHASILSTSVSSSAGSDSSFDKVGRRVSRSAPIIFLGSVYRRGGMIQSPWADPILTRWQWHASGRNKLLCRPKNDHGPGQPCYHFPLVTFKCKLILIRHEHSARRKKAPQGERRRALLAQTGVPRGMPSVHPTGVFRFHALAASPLKISTYPEHTARSSTSSSPRMQRCWLSSARWRRAIAQAS